MSKAEFKSEGLDALRLYLLAQPGGRPIRQVDLARHFGKDRSTIGRWLTSLEANNVPLIWDEQKRVAIDRKRYITYLSLSRHESIVLMLALRLYQQRQDKSDRNVVEMLQKLGVALHQGIAPKPGEHVLAIAQHQRVQLGAHHHDSQRTLEVLSDAWIDGRKVQIRYRPLNAKRAFDEVFHPYIFEPAAFSRNTYLIGYSELAGAIRVRKLERIERIPLVLDEPFAIAPEFDPFALVKGAWNIWFDVDNQPTRVCLRFTGDHVIRRVLEERWHPSQHSERDSEGRLIWRADIDEPQEMLPWIRGWGAECEVLEPNELREHVMGEVRRQMRMYGITETTLDNREQRFNDIFG